MVPITTLAIMAVGTKRATAPPHQTVHQEDKRIEVRSTRFMGRFMAREYVTIREEDRDGGTVTVETSVGRARLKLAPAKVTVKDKAYRIYSAAWGGAVDKVEVSIDGAAWQPATIDPTYHASYATCSSSASTPTGTPR